MENIYNYYKSTLEDYNSFQGISGYVESLLDNSGFHEKVKEWQASRHSAVEEALEDYLYSVHNVNIDNLRKQVRNCKNFRIKGSDKFRASCYKQGDEQRTEYYFGEDWILTAYSDGYIYYGAWKAMQQGFCC